jgi:hypothetical protein
MEASHNPAYGKTLIFDKANISMFNIKDDNN